MVTEALTLACKSILQHVKSEQSLEQLCNLMQVVALRCKLKNNSNVEHTVTLRSF